MFEKNNSNEEKKITLGPYFLIWDSINDQEIKNEEQNGWPYQIVNIEFVDLKTKFGNSRESTGIAAFQKYCLSCHSLYGTGGTVGPELASPVKITTYFKRDYLEKWILDPSSIRDRTPMPKVLPESMNLDEKKKIIREIINYLESVQKKSNS
jgi:cytochrome c2